MKTLITNVQAIEEQAQQLIEQADAAGNASVAGLRAREDQMIADTRTQAQKKAQAIMNEKVRSADQETNTIKQHSQNAVKTVHSAASKNRTDAVTLATRFFKEDYLS